MNKQIFMKQLESLLSPISAQERELALQYYENYFEDAGEEKEAEVLTELGSPEEVAKIIFDEVEYKEDVINTEPVLEEKNVSYDQTENIVIADESRTEKNEKTSNVRGIILGITAILWGPIWIGVIITIVVGLIPTAAILVLVFSLLAVIFGVLGIACFIGGLINLFVVPAFGVSLVGAGFVFLALAILFVLFVWLFASIIIPGLARLLAFICALPFKKKEEK